MKMGKRSVRQIHLPMIRSNSLTCIKGSLTSFLMDNTFPEESNDSGLGSDTTFILTDSCHPSSSESDMENCQDSADSVTSSSQPIQGLLALLSKRRPLASNGHQIMTTNQEGDEQMEPPTKKTRLEMILPMLSPSNASLQINENGNFLTDSKGAAQQGVLVVTTGKNVAGLRSSSPGCGLQEVVPAAIDSRMSSLISNHSQQTVAGRKRAIKKPSLHQSFPCRSRDGKVELKILTQPEEQHRARYMTEGSRGSIKDEKGCGFPTVQICGVSQPVTLHVFIGTDQGKVQPHLFYQACKVTGKNCTPCSERVLDGTTVIEINMLPEADMTVSCDCIGILKERNVDVEQRLPYFGLTRTKKKSTRCRMVFRVCVPMANGTVETLQVASSPILCTQSPGLPEICKKSLTECPAPGELELFIIGKNFQKDTRIVFQEVDTDDDSNMNATVLWEDSVQPEKEYFHQSHLVCRVPAYRTREVTKAVRVRLLVNSGGKSSLPHPFYYTPVQQVLATTTIANDSLFSHTSNVVDIGMENKFCNTSRSVSMSLSSVAMSTVSDCHMVKMEPLEAIAPIMHLTSNTPSPPLPLAAVTQQDTMQHQTDSVIQDLEQRIEQLQEERSLNHGETSVTLNTLALEDVKAATEDCLNQLRQPQNQRQREPTMDLGMHLPMPTPVLDDRQQMTMETMVALPMMDGASQVQPPAVASDVYLSSVVPSTPGLLAKEQLYSDGGCTNSSGFCMANDAQLRHEAVGQLNSVMAVPSPIVTPAIVPSANAELNCFNQNMTLEFSQLSDADLLSLINPSTFDNGMFAWEQTNMVSSMI